MEVSQTTQHSTGPPGKTISASSQAGSELNTSAGGTSRQGANVERRIAWLEEDVAVLHRRVKAECSELGGGASSDPGLRALVARLDGELAQERRLRESLEARMAAMEADMKCERDEREANMKVLSADLDQTMKGLIGRIDEGLQVGAASMRERTDQTEVRLRSLIKRVDEGLTAGAAALQDTLNTANDGLDSRNVPRTSMEPRPAGSRSSPPMTPMTKQQHLLQQQRQQSLLNPAFGQQSPQTMQSQAGRVQPRPAGSDPRISRGVRPVQAPSAHRSPVQTPSSAIPSSMQVPGSGLTAINPGGQVTAGMAMAGYPQATVSGIPQAGCRSPQLQAPRAPRGWALQ